MRFFRNIQHFISFILICFLGILSNYSLAQDWPKIYGDSFHSLINDISEIYDHGFILSSFTYEPYGFSKYIWMIKTDINGDILWEKKIGDKIHQYWSSNSDITIDNGIIISGATTQYSNGDFDPLFVKMNVCGEIEWCKVLLSADQNYGTDIIQTYDGSYVGLLTYFGEGPEYSRISLIRMDQSGEPIWIKQLAQEDTLITNEECRTLIFTSDSNYLITGRCFYPGLKPFWIKTDTTGNQTWDLKWSNGLGTCFQTIEQFPGLYYTIGYKIPPGHQNLPAIYKFDADGNEIDDYLILGDTVSRGGGRSILRMNDSTLLTGVVWGDYSIKDEIYHSEIVQTDTLGNLKNRRLLLLEDTAPSNLILTNDDKLLIAGDYVVDNNFDIYLWKMNLDLEDDTLYTQPMTYDSLCPYPITSDTADLNCSLFVNIDEIPTKEEYESTIKISPNPATEWITLSFPDNIATGQVKLSIYDLFGRQVMSRKIYPEYRLVSLNVSVLPAGMYLVFSCDTRNQVMKGKFIVSR